MEGFLKGKVAIVTGGSSNIGRTICLTLGREGASVVIADIDDVQGQKVAKTLVSNGASGLAIKTDTTNLESVEAMVKKTVDQFGTVDILVNVVGWDKPELFAKTSPEFWTKLIDLNFRSDLNTTKAVIGIMTEHRYGRIINIGSDAGRIGQYKEAVYAGCKAAVIAFSKSLAQELGRYGITVNSVCPGWTTPEKSEDVGERSMWFTAPPFGAEATEKAIKAYPLGRLGRPSDTAEAVAFLASDRASFITGQTLSVSGGFSMV